MMRPVLVLLRFPLFQWYFGCFGVLGRSLIVSKMFQMILTGATALQTQQPPIQSPIFCSGACLCPRDTLGTALGFLHVPGPRLFFSQ